jgi:predicted PurR-regulated permease PerM
MNLSFKNIFFALASVIAIFAILILGKSFFIPLSFALLLSFIVYPLTRKIESIGVGRLVSATLSVFIMLLLVGGGVYLLSSQIIRLTSEFTDIKEKFLEIFANITVFINKNVNIVPNLKEDDLIDSTKKFFSESATSLLGQTFTTTATLITGITAIIIFTFLFLIYRVGLVDGLAHFYPEPTREKAVAMFRRIQQVGKNYLLGMLMLISILGIANSIGLLIIGIDSPFLFGFMAALLAIIPFVGTFLGAAIPILYAFIMEDSIWMPIAVLIWFWAVQVVESNFLTPRIVGGSLKINALVALLSIFVGAAVWGIAGMILFLPFTAILRVICEEYEELEPIAILISEFNQPKKGYLGIYKKLRRKTKLSPPDNME